MKFWWLVAFLFCRLATASDLFSKTYNEARARFREGCQHTAGAVCDSYLVPSPTDADLSIDTASLIGKGHHLLILESGIHGPEGFAGSAAELLFLKKYAVALQKEGIDLVLIHTLNPYGMKYGRRTDEFNVNLNRNMSNEPGFYNAQNAGYVELRDLFEPAGEVRSIGWGSLKVRARFVWSLISSGFDKRRISQAMNSGQYQYDHGLNYGGQTPSAQNHFLSRTLRPLIKTHDGKILFLDFHTGLGEKGVLQILNGQQPGELLAPFREELGRASDAHIRFTDPNDTRNENVFTDAGDVIDYVPTLATEDSKVLALTLEYGTLGEDFLNQLATASRLVLENQAHFQGCTTPEICTQIKKEFVEVFNPADGEWQRLVTEEADRVFAALSGFFKKAY